MNLNNPHHTAHAPAAHRYPVSIDVKMLLLSILRHWYWIVLSVLLAFGVARLYLRYSVPVYKASGTILLKDKEGRGGENLSEEVVLEEFELLNPGNDIRNEIQILRSRTLMSEVVTRLGLEIQYVNAGRIKRTEYYGGTSQVLVDSIAWYGTKRQHQFEVQAIDDRYFSLLDRQGAVVKHAFGQPLSIGKDTFWLKHNPLSPSGDNRVEITTGIGPLKYVSKLSVRKSGDAPSILLIEMEDRVPERASDIIDTLVRVYNQVTIEDKGQIAQQTLNFIDRRLLLLSAELKGVEGGLENYKQQNSLQGEKMSSVSLFLRDLSNYESDLSEREVRLELLREVKSVLDTTDDSYEFEIIPANVIVRGSVSLDDQIKNFNRTLLERDRLKRSAGANNPQLQRMNQELVEMRTGILQSMIILIKNAELEVRETQNRIDNLRGKIEQVPRQERELLEIKRQQSIKQGLYLFLLEKKEEAALAAAIVVPNARVIDAAMTRPGPISPQPMKVYTLFLLFGMALPIAIVIVRELLDSRVYNEEDVKQSTSVPLIGVVARATRQDQPMINADSRSPVAELFRLLRADLKYQLREVNNPCVLVTSGESGEGKTFITANLGHALALTDKKVVVVDMNLRQPNLTDYLNAGETHEQPGLSEYLSGKARMEDLPLVSSIHPGLSFIGGGAVPSNPAELLSSTRTQALMNYLQDNFDYVLLDTAAIGRVADAYSLVPFADLTIFVARYAQTERNTLTKLEERAATGKFRQLAVVLNDVKVGKGKGYGYPDSGKRSAWWRKRKG